MIEKYSKLKKTILWSTILFLVEMIFEILPHLSNASLISTVISILALISILVMYIGIHEKKRYGIISGWILEGLLALKLVSFCMNFVPLVSFGLISKIFFFNALTTDVGIVGLILTFILPFYLVKIGKIIKMINLGDVDSSNNVSMNDDSKVKIAIALKSISIIYMIVILIGLLFSILNRIADSNYYFLYALLYLFIAPFGASIIDNIGLCFCVCIGLLALVIGMYIGIKRNKKFGIICAWILEAYLIVSFALMQIQNDGSGILNVLVAIILPILLISYSKDKNK